MLKAAVKPDRSYPWALFADCILILGFVFSNGWNFELDIQLYYVIATAVIFFIAMLRKKNRELLFSRLSLILLVLLAQSLLYFAGLFYAAYAKFALQQFYLNVGALFVFATAYVSFLRNELNFGRLITIFSVVIALAVLVSIELATSGLVRGFIIKFAGLFKAQVGDDYGAFETNTRITTVLGTPNVFAPMTVLAVFGSLWSCGSAGERQKKSFLHMSLAVVCGIGFILCFSLGTILVYAAVLLIYVIFTAKGEKGAQLFRHLYCIVSSLIGSSVVFSLRSTSILPLISVILISLLAAFAYTWLKPLKLPAVASKYKWGVFAGVMVLCAGFFICAAALRGPYSMGQGATLKRALALKPGTYTLRTATDASHTSAGLTVDISSQSYSEAALKIKTPLATAEIQPGQSVGFTVPEASAAVFVTFTATSDTVLTEAVIDDGIGSVRLPLRYKLLPEFIVNRLQGLWVNDNAIQRFIFFRDGIRLGLRSPIVGLGGGAFEGGILSVADYYYQTKHAHNEFIQRFVDGGILGLLLFAALVVAVFRALYNARKNEKFKPIYALLFAFMAMIFLHSLIEVDFLMVSYRSAASILIAAVAAMSRDAVILGKKVIATIRTSLVLTFAVTVLLSFGTYFANKMIDWKPTLKSLQDAMWMDPFNKTGYEISYLISTSAMTQPYIIRIQNDYLSDLDNQVVGADALARIYLTRTQPDGAKGTKTAELYIRENRVNPDAWNSIFSLYLSILNNAETDGATNNAVIASSHRLLIYLDELNSTLPLKITPDGSLLSMIETILNKPLGQ